MAARRKPQMSRRVPQAATADSALKQTTRRRSRPAPTTADWRRRVRPRLLRAAVAATESVHWSPALLDTLMDELYVADRLEALLTSRLRDLPVQRYPQAIVMAVLLRHSWRADDLDWIIDRLGLKVAHQ